MIETTKLESKSTPEGNGQWASPRADATLADLVEFVAAADKLGLPDELQVSDGRLEAPEGFDGLPTLPAPGGPYDITCGAVRAWLRTALELGVPAGAPLGNGSEHLWVEVRAQVQQVTQDWTAGPALPVTYAGQDW